MCIDQKVLDALEEASEQINRALPERDEALRHAMDGVADFGKKFSEQHEKDFQALRERVYTQLGSGMRRTHADPV